MSRSGLNVKTLKNYLILNCFLHNSTCVSFNASVRNGTAHSHESQRSIQSIDSSDAQYIFKGNFVHLFSRTLLNSKTSIIYCVDMIESGVIIITAVE